MSYTVRVLTWSAAFLLLGSGIWANMGDRHFPESRGLWVTQAMRGMGPY
jgi:hypothetical protein